MSTLFVYAKYGTRNQGIFLVSRTLANAHESTFTAYFVVLRIELKLLKARAIVSHQDYVERPQQTMQSKFKLKNLSGNTNITFVIATAQLYPANSINWSTLKAYSVNSSSSIFCASS